MIEIIFISLTLQIGKNDKKNDKKNDWRKKSYNLIITIPMILICETIHIFMIM